MMSLTHSSMYAEPHGGGSASMRGGAASAARNPNFLMNYNMMSSQVERTILTPGLAPIPPCTPNRTNWGESGLNALPPSSVKADR